MKRAADAYPNGRLRRERELRCWSQLEIADAIGTTAFNVSRWERGITIPNAYFRRQLCQLFDKSPQELGFLDAEEDEGPIERTAAHEPGEAQSDLTQAIWNVPFRRNSYFTGRESVLVQIHELLKQGQARSLSPRIVSLSGLGGIGKTQVAIEYAFRYAKDYTHVLWLQADSHTTLYEATTFLSPVLSLSPHNGQDQASMLKAIRCWLSTATNWLLVLDDLDDPRLAYDLLPAVGDGAVLITTLTPITATIARGIELESMSCEEGATFLLRRAKILAANRGLEQLSKEQRQLTEAITQSMGGLPLALDQAAAYIEETGCGLAGYLERYRQHREVLLSRRGGLLPEHPVSLSTTWSLSLEKIARLNPEAINVLRLLAFLNAEVIPERIIVTGASEVPLLSAMRDPLVLDAAIGTLRAFSLVRRLPEAASLTVHRLVQEVLQDQMDECLHRQWAEYVVRIIHRVFRECVRECWSFCQHYLPHVRECARLIERWNMLLPEAVNLLNEAGAYLRERAQYDEAESLLRQGVKVRERLAGSCQLVAISSGNY